MKGAYVYLISFFLATAAFSQCGQSPGNPQGSDTTGNQGGAQGGAPTDTSGNQGGAPMDTSGNMGTDTSGQGGGDYLDIQSSDTTGNQGMDTTGGQGNQGQGGQGQMPSDTTGGQGGQQGGQGQMPSDTTGDKGKAKMLDTITGTVDSIDTTSSGPNSPMSLTMTNQLGQTMKVILGPQSFLKEMNFSVKKGDSIEVIGQPSQSGGKNTIIAYQVRKGQTTLLLRDENGTPLWSGRGRP
jgi:hypothetical protein